MATRSDAEVEVEWYTALYEEDCRQLLKLLEERESLWSKGWESEPKRRVTGRPRNYWSRSRTREWKGRTALHVAARRGCVHLIERVVTLCKENRVGSLDQSGRDDREDGRENRNSDEEERLLLREDTDSSDSDKSHVGSEERSVSPVFREDTELGDEKSALSLEKFLLRKDDRYKLDAFAMALVNGNPDVIVALLEASNGCPILCDQYRIKKSFCERDPTYQSTAQGADHRSLLRKITEDLIEGERPSSGPLLDEVVLGRYERHRDFNFLPREEYLFHFLLAPCRAKELRFLTGSQASLSDVDRLYKRLRTMLMEKVLQADTTAEFPCFLWELQDGQGRPPLHVTVDEDSFICALDLLEITIKSNEAEVVERILTARDGGGRTFWHRVAALGKTDAFERLRLTMPIMALVMLTPQLSSWWDGIWKDGALYKIDLNVVSSFHGFFRDLSRWTAKSQAQGYHAAMREASAFVRGIRVHEIMPLHSAILLKQSSWIEKLAEILESMPYNPLLAQWTQWDYSNLLGRTICLASSNTTERGLWRTRRRAAAVDFDDSTKPRVVLDCVGLAAMVGDVPVLLAVLEIQRILRTFRAAQGRIPEDQDVSLGLKMRKPVHILHKMALRYLFKEDDELLPTLHIAAASGRYDLLKMFIHDPLFDPFVVDLTGNTALHCAAKGLPVHFGHHLIDFVNCEQILKTEKDRSKDSDDRSARQDLHDDSFLVEREGCINRLLQFGCDIWEMNADGEAPYPSNDMSYKFLSWWYDKQAKEFGTNQKYLSSAANAVSVTGALVATASFVGPLQPPGEIASELRMGNWWMKTFIVCDTMSFYLAIVAIIFSLVPTLPMPQQSMTDELRRTRRMVTLAVVTLFPSIIFVLIAFGSAFLVATESHAISIGTAAAGGFMGLLAFLLFSVRVLAFSFRRSKIIRKLYDKTSF